MANRVALGQLRDGTYGLEISQAGFDVLNAGISHENLVFSTKWAHAAGIHAAGMVASTVSGVTVSFAALDYVPVVQTAFYNSSTGRLVDRTLRVGTVPNLHFITGPSAVVANNQVRLWTDEEFYVGGNWNIRYFVLKIAGGV